MGGRVNRSGKYAVAEQALVGAFRIMKAKQQLKQKCIWPQVTADRGNIFMRINARPGYHILGLFNNNKIKIR